MIIVTCNGCFDGIHPGHLFFLGFCRAQGDVLKVGINSDSYIKENKRDPFYDEETRKKALMSLGFIDEVFIFNESTPIDFLKRIHPDIHCNGEEYGESCIESETCKQLGIQLVLVPRINNFATTGMDSVTESFVKYWMCKLQLRGN